MSEIPWKIINLEQLKFLISKSNENWIVDGDKKTVRSAPKHTRVATPSTRQPC